jgi:ankyrin repeat protein
MFRRAAGLGHPVAQANLGKLYADGVGVEKDVTKAKEFLALAAAQGNPEARASLDALQWRSLEDAAATGDADAVAKLAAAYEEVAREAFDFIKTNRLQAAVNTIVRAPNHKKVPIAEIADEQGMTALHWAVRNRNAAGTRWLLDKGPDLERTDDQGRTPLEIALDNQDSRTMSLLINWGARASTALPGHEEELKALTKTSDIVDFMIKTAAADAN